MKGTQGEFPSFFSPSSFVPVLGCISTFINQGSMCTVVEQSALLQSGIDRLTGWAFCQSSLVVSVLSPFFVTHLSLADVGAW